MPDNKETTSVKTKINLIPGTINENDAKNIVSKYSEHHSVQVQKLIYYPYYWFLFSFTVKTLFGKSRSTKASCLVDLINNHAATTDSFDIAEKEVLTAGILEQDYTQEQALKTAKTYLMHSSIHNMKVLFAPDSEILKQSLVHKPFWIVKCTNRDRHSFKVIVDAVTGKFQVL
ncbi:MAG: hypothetical protein PQJ61_09930 [Spirochaetales bacterium]|uniref:Uncharacterized protein n=1 Tax=Candidatus Thalassospirochaeta sargassi TaxID=3119039 RepID=A0AAJ1IFJ9_9SPIO|nr:hypothetical protein [Spirochaetales bacterium]